MQDAVRTAGLVAQTKSTTLITGETGTGKELIARAIHARSAERERPLIKINCAAIPESLLESELFGHVKGAFTGATANKKGRFALADGGTIFLDEIATMSQALQAKLLRVLQEREFEPLGSERTQKVDVRVIAATNRDLRQMASEGRFQEDLYYRLNVIPITLPPLRERREDIPVLIEHFVHKHAQRAGKRIERIEDGVMPRLQAYDWPGNVRELENTIERGVVLSPGSTLTALTLSVPGGVSSQRLGQRAVAQPAAEPRVDREGNRPQGARHGQGREEGCRRADGHLAAGDELLPRQAPHRLSAILRRASGYGRVSAFAARKRFARREPGPPIAENRPFSAGSAGQTSWPPVCSSERPGGLRTLSRSLLFRSLRWGLFIAVSGLAMGGCDEKLSDLTGPTPNLKPTLSSIQSEIFSQRCIGCHTGAGRFLPGIMNLTEGNSYASLVGVTSIEKPALQRVAPGDPENSYIIHKLEGRAGIAGARMPFNGTPLTDGQILVIKRWIELGAPNN